MAGTSGNLYIFKTNSLQDTIDAVLRHGRPLHFTNGTFIAGQELVLPTTLGGFNYIADHIAAPKDAFAIAVNSNKSLEDANVDYEEDEINRALKVLRDLSRQHPNRKVIGIFYDEETPQELYEGLKQQGADLKTLHKWGGYGVGKDTPVIIGEENFDRVLAFPFQASAQPPAFYDKTRIGDQTERVEVVDLHHLQRPNGDPYMALKR